MSMLSDFLKENQLTSEQLLTASKALETLKPEDRAGMVKRAGARRDKKTYAELQLAKPPALGRGFSGDVLARAIEGKPVPRLVRRKITRAVNQLLASAKKEAVDGRKLFNDARVKKGAAPKKKVK